MDRSAPPASAIEAFSEFERFLEGAAKDRYGLGEVERESDSRGRELVRLMLQAHLDARGDGDVGAAIVVQAGQAPRRLAYKRIRARRVLTVFGELKLTRAGYGAPGEATVYPLDQQLQLPARSYSYECQRRLIRTVVCTPFDEAIALVELTGVTVPKRSAEQLVREAAVDFDGFYAQREATDVKPADDEIIVAAIDCKGIPMVKPERALRVVRRGKGQKANKKRMATVAAVHNQAPVVRTPQEVLDSLFGTGERREPEQPRPRPGHKRVWASLTADKTTFIADVKAEMTRRDPDRQHTWVIVTDGERALQHRVADSFEDVTLVLDLLHVLEKLWKAAHALHRETSPEAQAFVYQRAKRILEGGVDQVVKGLKLIVTKRQLTASKAKTLLDVAAYYKRNRERMRYDTYLANGWPIASGTVEGACKNLIRDRFERSGMRWTQETAEAMLRMRATHLSGDFDNYWNYHVKRDQQRLYPSWQVDSK